MLDYSELYEYLRKEKYGDQLQALPKEFISEVGELLKEKRPSSSSEGDFFSEEALKAKKNFENSISLFKELMRLRKRKILNLVFIASETGIMKRDFGTMLPFEQELFEQLVVGIERADKGLQQELNGKQEVKREHTMVITSQQINAFVDMQGNSIGPFDKGTLVNLDAKIAAILVSEGKASQVDE